MKKISTTFLVAPLYTILVLGIPLLAFAEVRSAKRFISRLMDSLETITVILIGLAVIAFLWGVVKYMTQYGDPAKRSDSVKMMIYGIISIFVMISVWGLVFLVGDIIGVPVEMKGTSPGYEYDFDYGTGLDSDDPIDISDGELQESVNVDINDPRPFEFELDGEPRNNGSYDSNPFDLEL